jgi:hypothetical protein
MRHRREPVEPSLRPRHELDAIVANVELTLISIVQGVALYFLADNARSILAELRLSALPYALTGLLMILTIWSRSLLHAFTVIRWPLELGHNFFYITVTLVEAALFTQLGTPRTWYPMCVVIGLIFLVMFAYERRMYRARMADSGGVEGAALIRVLEREHLLNLRVLVPLMLLGWGGSAALVLRYPALFLDEGWHVALGIVQALGMLGYLAHVWRFYVANTPQILAARTEWDAAR